MKEKNKVKILEILMCHIESIHHQEYQDLRASVGWGVGSGVGWGVAVKR